MTEFGFIDTIKSLFDHIPSNGFEGIGDDCAVLPLGDGDALVFTTDVLIEDIHFLRRGASAFEIGAKSLSVNLSDVAAMGARPVAALLSLALTADARGEWAMEFMRGYRSVSERWGVALVGGDTSSSLSSLSVSVTAIGRVNMNNIKRRSSAVEGDTIMVCGTLGESAEGLRDILAGRCDTAAAHAHRNPEAQIREGIWLGGRKEVHAMMDLSDGLASDLMHILKASGVGAVVDTESIPAYSDTATAVCGGEDYKLLFTVDTSHAERLTEEFMRDFGCRPSAVGRIVSGSGIEWRLSGGAIVPDWSGFSHF